MAVFFGCYTGGVTFTGSLIAFAKLQGLMKSNPVLIPFHNQSNIAMGVASLASLGIFAKTESFGVGITSLMAGTTLS